MRISHRHRFVFLSNAKCGSESIRKILDPYSDVFSDHKNRFPYNHHMAAREMKDHFEQMGWDWSQYFVFTTIRNPWDRVCSHYHHGAWDANFTPRWEPEKYDPNTRCSFEDFIKNKSKRNNMWPVVPYDEWAYDKAGNCLVHACLFIPELSTTLPPILDRLGLTTYKIYHINTSKHTHYSEYYTPETRDLIGEMFKFDIQIFGFTYEDAAGDANRLHQIKSSRIKI